MPTCNNIVMVGIISIVTINTASTRNVTESTKAVSYPVKMKNMYDMNMMMVHYSDVFSKAVLPLYTKIFILINLLQILIIVKIVVDFCLFCFCLLNQFLYNLWILSTHLHQELWLLLLEERLAHSLLQLSELFWRFLLYGMDLSKNPSNISKQDNVFKSIYNYCINLLNAVFLALNMDRSYYLKVYTILYSSYSKQP